MPDIASSLSAVSPSLTWRIPVTNAPPPAPPAQCRHLVRTLTALEQTSEQRERHLSELEAARQALQQELVTTSASYETQVAAMSDHLAGLNETLTAQRDQIDQLRYQLGLKKRGVR